MCGASDTAHLSTLWTPTPIVVTSGYRYSPPMTDDRRTGTRVNLTLPDEVVAVLDRLQSVTGAGRATFIREWLTEAVPQLQELARAIEMAQDKNLDALKVLGDVMGRVSNDADQLQLDMKKTRRAAMRKKPK